MLLCRAESEPPLVSRAIRCLPVDIPEYARGETETCRLYVSFRARLAYLIMAGVAARSPRPDRRGDAAIEATHFPQRAVVPHRKKRCAANDIQNRLVVIRHSVAVQRTSGNIAIRW